MKVTPSEKPSVIVAKTSPDKRLKGAFSWWEARTKADCAEQLVATAMYLKQMQGSRYKSAILYARMYGNMSISNSLGPNVSVESLQNLPTDRPTFNIVQSASDTLLSRISQNRPSPVFLTDNGDYRQRNMAKKLNNFVQGEFYGMKAYEKGTLALRDALVEGTGVLKVYKDINKRVAVDRVFLTELLTDPTESIYGDPRQMYQLKLMDRSVLKAWLPDEKSKIEDAEQAYLDSSGASQRTVSDLVLVVEGWRLPSSKDAKDGRHTIACSSGMLLDEEWTKDKFPFVFLHYCPRLLGFWAQGLAEQLMGTQIEINSLLYTISKAIRLVGVPRVFVEDGSKVVKEHFNNNIGSIVTFRGTKPQYEVAPCVPQELYTQLQRLIDYGYQQSGVSAMQASSVKPAGLNSGEAIRSYDDISSDRFNALARRYDNMYIDLAYQVVDLAKEIAEEDGKYSTVYPSKNAAKEIDLPECDILKDTYVIQCFNMSSLPRDPAGRLQKVTEMTQAGMISIKEGRRLLDYPDTQQMDVLASASEERIFQYLDSIIEDGEYTGPDPFMDLDLAKEISVQYYNLYASAKLEENKQQMLRDFYAQTLDLMQAAATPPMPAEGVAPPIAVPEAPPTSPILPFAQGGMPVG